MKELTKNIYYAKEEMVDEKSGEKFLNIRLWHNCEKYKNRDMARVEILKAEETEDIARYVCPYCGFEYILDKNLKLA